MTPLLLKQKIEYARREFFGDDFWIRHKQKLDSLLAFRNTIKGRPTPEQLITLEFNKWEIDFLKRLLYGGNSDIK